MTAQEWARDLTPFSILWMRIQSNASIE